jgi:superfamily II DNA/RNA helicase
MAGDVPFDWSIVKAAGEEWEKCRWGDVVKTDKRMNVEDWSPSPEDIAAFLRNEIYVGMHGPKPVMNFDDAFAQYPGIINDIKQITGFRSPTPFQCQAFPVCVSGMDMLAIAPPGSGKTMGYLLPLLIRLQDREEGIGPVAIILVANEDLAIQVTELIQKMGRTADCIFDNKMDVKVFNVCDFIVGTAQIIRQLFKRDDLDVSKITAVVVDDCIMDAVWKADFKVLLLNLRPDKQLIVINWNFDDDMPRLTHDFFPFMFNIGKTLELRVSKFISHEADVVNEEDKVASLNDFLNARLPNQKVLCFFGKKQTISAIASDRALLGEDISEFHEGLEREDRQLNLQRFRDGETKVMFATNLASKGIDVDGITHVFNFDCPKDMEEYIHREGRVTKPGTVTTLIMPNKVNFNFVRELTSVMFKSGLRK